MNWPTGTAILVTAHQEHDLHRPMEVRYFACLMSLRSHLCSETTADSIWTRGAGPGGDEHLELSKMEASMLFNVTAVDGRNRFSSSASIRFDGGISGKALIPIHSLRRQTKCDYELSSICFSMNKFASMAASLRGKARVEEKLPFFGGGFRFGAEFVIHYH